MIHSFSFLFFSFFLPVPHYDADLRVKILEILKREEVKFKDGGVYLQSMGPRFETKAEIRFMATCGDVVGMTGEVPLSSFFEEIPVTSNSPFAPFPPPDGVCCASTTLRGCLQKYSRC